MYGSRFCVLLLTTLHFMPAATTSTTTKSTTTVSTTTGTTTTLPTTATFSLMVTGPREPPTVIPWEDNPKTKRFIGWPDQNTNPPPEVVLDTRTVSGINTIPCPFCVKKKDEEEVCRPSPIWCDVYQGCWYFTDTRSTLYKGCIDIVPSTSGFVPNACNDFYKDGVCFKGSCLLCDVYGLGGSTTLTPSVAMTTITTAVWILIQMC